MTSLIVFKDHEIAAKIAEAVREIARIEREMPILKATVTRRQARADLWHWKTEKKRLENEQQRRAEQPKRNRA